MPIKVSGQRSDRTIAAMALMPPSGAWGPIFAHGNTGLASKGEAIDIAFGVSAWRFHG